MTSLTLGTPYSGTLAGSGQAQLFAVTVPATQSLLVTLQDSTSADVNQVYAKLGSPPTPGNYAYEFASGVAANQQLLVPSAAPGTWYILVVRRVGPRGQQLHPRGHGHADQLTARRSGSVGDGQHGHADPDRLGLQQHHHGRAGPDGRHGLHGQQRVARHVHATDRHVRPDQCAAGGLLGGREQPRRSELRAGGGVHRDGSRGRRTSSRT